MNASNVGELIDALKTLDPKARIYTIEPPFDGLKMVRQEDGAILFCRPREPELKSAPRSSQLFARPMACLECEETFTLGEMLPGKRHVDPMQCPYCRSDKTARKGPPPS